MNHFYEDTPNTPDTEEERKQEAVFAGEIVNGVDSDTKMQDEFANSMACMKAGMFNDCGNDDDTEKSDSNMNASDYHNKALDFAISGDYRHAADVCLKGLKRFPLNVDLLADTIRYSSDSGDKETAAKYYEILKTSIPFSRWNWFTFSFSIDYLLSENPTENEAECRMLVDNFKKWIPYGEKACLAESQLEMAFGNRERSMEILGYAITTRSNASMCALHLANMQMERGMYEAVVNTANYGIAASAEVEPSINVPYLYYLRALAKDHLIHKKEHIHNAISAEEVRAMEKEYHLLLEKFPGPMFHYSVDIEMRIAMLAFIPVTD